MKPICIVLSLFLLLLISASLKSQTFTANYTYDANGNRLSATVVYLSQSSSSPSPSSGNGVDADQGKVEDQLKVDALTNLMVRIFPNPTQGDLRVELAGATPEQLSAPSNAIRVWDMQGRLLFSVSPMGSTNTVDLSRYSNGTYIMQLFFNGKMKDYKIVKN